MFHGDWIAMASAAILGAAILIALPSAPRVAEWINGQLRQIDEEKLLVG